MKLKNKLKKNFGLSLLVLLAFLLLQNIIYAFFQTFTKNIGILYIFAYLIPIIIYFIFYRKELIAEFNDIKKLKKKDILKVIIAYLILSFLMYLSNFIFYKLIGNIADNEVLVREAIKNNFITMSIAVTILGPIFEELLYRFTFKDTIKNKLVNYLITSFIFAFMHITLSSNLLEMLFIVPYLFMSLSFGYGIYKTDNIYVSIFIHSIHNIINLVLLYIV